MSDKKEAFAHILYKKDYPLVSSHQLLSVIKRLQKITSSFFTIIETITNQISKKQYLVDNSINDLNQIQPMFPSIDMQSKLLAKISRASQEIAEVSRADLSRTIEDISRIIEIVQKFNDTVENTKVKSLEIAKITAQITELALENKVTAINSSISSNKAGVSGKSFSVIAGEITTLSNKTTEYSHMIRKKTAHIQSNSELMIRQMKKCLESSKKTVEIINSAYESMGQISESINNAIAGAEEITTLNRELNEKCNELNKTLLAMNDNVADQVNITESCLLEIRQQNDTAEHLFSIGKLAAEISDTSLSLLPKLLKKEKIFKMSDFQLTQSDPILSDFIYESHYCNYTCIKLVQYGSNNAVVPYLAETWVIKEDEVTWVFKLRENVLFHDGSEITTDDVKFSFERVLNPALKSPHAKKLSIIKGADEYMTGQSSSVSGIRIINRYTIEFELKNKYHFFLSILTSAFASIIKKNSNFRTNILSRKDIVSAGPFKYVYTDETEQCDHLIANPQYIEGPPYIDQLLVYRNIDNLYEAIATHKIDFMARIQENVENQLKKSGFGNYLHTIPSRLINGLNINFMKNNIITRHKEIRQALCHAINKEEICSIAYKSRAYILESVLPNTIFDMGTKKYFEYNPNKAKDIIDSFREKDNCNDIITLALVKNPKAIDLQEAIKIIEKNLTSIGLNIQIKEIDPKNANVEEYRKYDLCYLRWISEIDPYFALEPFINPEGTDNYFHYTNNNIYDSLNKSIFIKNPQERYEFFIKLLDQINEDVFIVPVVVQQILYSCNPSLKNVSFSSTESLQVHKIFFDDSETPEFLINLSDDYRNHIIKNYNAVTAKFDSSITNSYSTNIHLVKQIQFIVKSLEQENQQIADLLTVLENFITISSTVNQQCINSNNIMNDAIKEIHLGEEITQSIAASIKNLKADLSLINNSINFFIDDLHEIREILGHIENISSTIDKIAVNASIIAAKSGNWEDNFLNVSLSIQDLSDKTKQYIHQINEILEASNILIFSLQNSISESIDRLSKSIVNINTNKNTLSKINATMQTTKQPSNEIITIIQTLLYASNSVYESNQSIKETSKRVLSYTDSIKIGSNVFSSMFEELKNRFDAFKLIKHLLQENISNDNLFDYELHFVLNPQIKSIYDVHDLDTQRFIQLISTTLIQKTGWNSLIPSIAERWNIEKDNVTWIFHLKKNLFFNSKKALSAADVKNSLEKTFEHCRIKSDCNLNIKGLPAFLKGESSHITGISIIDQYTISISLEEQDSFIEYKLSQFQFPILSSESQIDTLNIDACGSFKINKYDAKSHKYELLSNPHFCNGKPFIDRVNLYTGISENEKLTAFINKEIDFIYLNQTNLQKIKQINEYSSCIKSTDSPYAYYLTFNFNLQNIFTTSREARHVFAQTIDRDTIIKEVFQNNAYNLSSYLPFPHFQKNNISSYSYNPSKASTAFRILRDKSKVFTLNDLSIACIVNNDLHILKPMSNILLHNFNVLGFSVHFEFIEYERYLSLIRSHCPYDILLVSKLITNQDLFTLLNDGIEARKYAINTYNNDKLILKLKQTLSINNPKKRFEIIDEVNNDLSQEYAWIFLVRGIDYFAYQPHLHNFSLDQSIITLVDFDSIWLTSKEKKSQ